MKWYKKLQEKKAKTSNELGTKIFGEFWYNVKGRSAILLLLWIIFIAIVLVMINTNKQSDNVTSSEATFNQIDTYFSNSKNYYSYNISIENINNVTFTYYNGEVSSNGDMGVKSKDGEDTNYQIKDNIAYDTLTNKEIDNLYDDYLSYFFNLNNIYAFIKDKTPITSVENDIKTYQYNETYNGEKIDFVIKTSLNEITYIEYTFSNYKYIINIA